MRKYIFFKKNISKQSGFSTIQIILLTLGGFIIVGGIVSEVIYFSRQPEVKQIQQGFCGDGICGVVEKERGVCMEDCEVNTATTSSQTQNNDSLISTKETIDDNSFDADGFLWGTETYPDKIDQVKDVINDTLKVSYIKKRLQMSMVTKDGKIFTEKSCLPSQLNCLKQNDLDEAAKLFKENGWSMVPMLSYDPDDKTIESADIDNFVEFVDWFVSRYKNDANIKYIELVNSPVSWWNGTDKQLVDLMNKVYDRIKNKYPDIMIGTPGFEYWNDVEGEKAIRQLEYVLDKNNGAKFDFLAFHGYPLGIMQKNVIYPPTSKAKYSKLTGIYGLLEIRRILDANGWENRTIIDTEHTGLFSTKQSLSENEYLTDAAFMAQELLVKKTLQLDGKNILSGILPFKIAPRGRTGEFAWASLKSDGSITHAIEAIAILLDKFNEYNYHSRISGDWDAESTPWIEKFTSGGNKELYIFFKPFEYKSGQNIAFDNKTVKYTLVLNKKTSKITLTDTYGATSNVTPATSITLEAVNAPKFLEVEY